MNTTLKISSFPGVRTDCLGNYLMALGLLNAATQKSALTRGFWRTGVFHLAADYSDRELVEFLQTEWQPSRYLRWWSQAQKLDTKEKSSSHYLAERAIRSINEVRSADSTIVGLTRNVFNPLFGTGGNIGKRNLESAWVEANRLCKDTKNSVTWLKASLFGIEASETPPFTNAGTWFVYNNKAFNSGLNWYREGSLSPWSFLLAMEGALLVRGASSRRLGHRTRPYAVFPFISQSLQPETENEIGQKAAGEFWAPLWDNPATFGEIRALFQRGLARLGGRAAIAPHEFAVAALARGTDAGISKFVRYELRQTTSSQVYEAIPRNTFSVARGNETQRIHPSQLLLQITGPGWLDRLPFEPTTRQSKKRFSGLRGPIERLILAVAEEPERGESWQALMLRLAATQSRVDHNIEFRKSCIAVPPLRVAWFHRAFPDNPPAEIRVAAALAALGAATEYPAICNIHGVKITKRRVDFSRPGRPQRAVWHDGQPLAALLDFVQRRLIDSPIDYQEGRNRSVSLDTLAASIHLPISDIAAFIDPHDFDIELVQRWVPPLALIKWQGIGQLRTNPVDIHSPEADLLLWAFFKPFFHCAPLDVQGRPFFRDGGGAKAGFARQLFALLRHGMLGEATVLARSGYETQGLPLITPPVTAGVSTERLAAALALPISPADLARLTERWIQPAKTKMQVQ